MSAALLAVLAVLGAWLAWRSYRRSNAPEVINCGVSPGSSAFPHGGARSRIGLEYCSAGGELTERVVRIAALVLPDHPSSIAYVVAWCELREEPRCFRSDRILGLYDPETGENFSAVDFTIDPSVVDKCREKIDEAMRF